MRRLIPTSMLLLFVASILLADMPSGALPPASSGWREIVGGFFLSFFAVVGGNRLFTRFRRHK
jgi:hypothetical protein